jgi:hypothetical protein
MMLLSQQLIERAGPGELCRLASQRVAGVGSLPVLAHGNILESAMKEIADVLNTVDGTKAERLAAQQASLARRIEIWNDIQEGNFPDT